MPRFHQICIVKAFLDILLTFGWGSTAGLSIQAAGLLSKSCVGRERWTTQLSRTPSKASARDAEQHSTPSGSSLVTIRAKLHDVLGKDDFAL
jgi:hypothetical protein